MNEQNILERNNVTIHGEGEKAIVLAHGFGCDKRMWRFLLPTLSKSYKVILFDYVGSGGSKLSQFSIEKYSTLNGYAQDVLDIIQALELENVTFIGHSVSSMIGLIASLEEPDLFSEQIMVCPSPCFLNDPPSYQGGFESSDLDELINLMDKNYIGWAEYLAPLVMGQNASQELVGELSGSFCSTDPTTAKAFAKATFFSDHRDLLPKSDLRTLIIQSASDSLASVHVGEYLNENLGNSVMQIINSTGHCLHMTDPDETNRLIFDFLKGQ